MSQARKIQLISEISILDNKALDICKKLNKLHQELALIERSEEQANIYNTDNLDNNTYNSSNVYITTTSYYDSTLDNLPHDDPFYEESMATSEDGSISTGFMYSIK